jgi:hypothetical protein
MKAVTKSVSTGILDNDPKGKTGVGTVHWMEVVIRYEWGLLEELDGTFNPDEVKKFVPKEKK